MKIKIKRHFTYAALFCALGTAAVSCKKDKEETAPLEADAKLKANKSGNIASRTFINSLNIGSFNSNVGSPIATTPGASTPLEFRFTIEANDSTLNSQFKVQLLYIPKSGPVEVVTDIGMASFRGRQATGYVWSSKINGTLAAGKTQGSLSLKLITGTFPNESTTSSVNSFQLKDASAPVEKAVVEGDFYRVNGSGMIYLGMDGKMRHLQDANTLYGVFKSPPISNVSPEDFSTWFPAHKIGNPIGPNTRLVEDTNNGQAYYQEDGVLRYITSPGVASRYKFDLKKAVKIHGTGGYTFGPSFQ